MLSPALFGSLAIFGRSSLFSYQTPLRRDMARKWPECWLPLWQITAVIFPNAASKSMFNFHLLTVKWLVKWAFNWHIWIELFMGFRLICHMTQNIFFQFLGWLPPFVSLGKLGPGRSPVFMWVDYSCTCNLTWDSLCKWGLGGRTRDTPGEIFLGTEIIEI